MIEEFLKFIKEKNLFQKKHKILAAVSGGPDSVAMLDLLMKTGFKTSIIHCNFLLRGKESDRDEDFVRELAKKYNIKIFVKKCNARKYARKKRISLEMAARELRYDFFREIAETEKFDFVATGHNADDNVETFLLNLTRKTGLKGLTGIPVKNGIFVRPLLFASRHQVINYCRKNRISFVIDSSNLGTDFNRNKIRHSVIPEFEKINLAFQKNVWQTIENLKDYWTNFLYYYKKFENKCIEKKQDCLSVDIDCLKNYGTPKLYLLELLENYGFTSDNISKLANSLKKQSGIKFETKDYILVKDRKKIILWKKDLFEYQEIIITEPKDIIINKGKPDEISLKFQIKDNNQDFKFERNNDFAYFDFKKLKFPLKLRKWKKGDFFIPFGMKGKKKLSDFFNDNKISEFEKRKIWILESNGKIAWITGYRSSNEFAVTPNTSKILIIKKL